MNRIFTLITTGLISLTLTLGFAQQFNETQKITGTGFGPANTSYFGTSVAISGDYTIVGAPGYDYFSTLNTGAAYIHEKKPF